MKLFSLEGRKAIVTGGSRGLGRGIAEGLHEAGAEVVVTSVSDRALSTAEELNAGDGPPVHGVRADLSTRSQVKEMFSTALERLGGNIDILVNNAGIQRRHRCEDFPERDWDEVLEVNLNAVFLLCQMAGRSMLEQGGGKIINVASMLSFFGGYTVPAYAASKGGVAQLTKALANEWAARNVNVNALAPGYMATDMNEALLADSERDARILSRIPADRWGEPQDMKGIAIFLASPAADYIHGAVIPVDGGYLGR